MRSIVALLLVLGLAPSSEAAYTMEATLTNADAPLMPIEESATVEITVTADCQDVLMDMDQEQQRLQVDLDHTVPDTMLLSGAARVDLPTSDCLAPTGSTSGSTSFQLTMLREAAGLVPLDVVFSMQLPPRPAGAGEAPAPITVTLTPEFFSLIEVITERKLVRVDGDERDFEVHVTNFGNAETRVSAFADCSAGSVVLESFLLDRLDGPQAARSVPASFKAPDGRWDEAFCEITFVPEYAFDDSRIGPATNHTIAFRNDSDWGKTVPAPPAVVLLVLLGAVVAVRRR